MARLTRLMLVVGSVIGFSTAAPNTSQAGVIPWIYDAIFGPVGSIRYGAGYNSYGGYGYSGYSNYGLAYSGYTPTTVAYAPTTSYSYGYGGGSCNSCAGGSCNSCSSCNTTNYGTTSYIPYGSSSSCNNCSVGGSYGGSQTTSYPAPDPNSVSRDVQYRLENVEHDIREIKKFLQRKHDTEFSPDPYSRQNNTFRRDTGDPRREEMVPARTKIDRSFSSESDPNNSAEQFSEPRRRDRNTNDELRNKPELPINPPPTGNEDKKVTEEKKTEKAPQQETDPQTMRLDRRITTRAIAPKERLANTAIAQPKASAVKTARKPTKPWLDSSNASEVARH